jgi:hypothetical protein
VTQSPTSEQSSEHELKNPRTLFAEFPEVPLGKDFILALRKVMLTGVYSINAPIKDGGCRVAVQIEGAKIEEANQIARDMRGSPGAVVTPRRTKQQSTEQQEKAEGEPDDDMAKTKKSTKAAKVSKKASPRFAKKTECAAPGHGEYGDIELHNKKHHGGKAYVAPKEK